MLNISYNVFANINFTHDIPYDEDQTGPILNYTANISKSKEFSVNINNLFVDFKADYYYVEI